MSSAFTIGPMAFYIVLHIFLLMATAAWGSDGAQCGNIPSWACGSPFESVAARNPQNANLIGLALGVITGLFKLVFDFLIIDYDILKGDGAIIGGIGFVVRAIGWTLVGVAVIGMGFQLLGRK